MMELFGLQISWRELLDIGLVALVYYYLILLVRGTRAVAVIYGLLLLLFIYYVSAEVGLYTLNWLLTNFLGSIFLVIIILFQRDIRKALAQVGAGWSWRRNRVKDELVETVARTLTAMASARIGGIVVFERSVPLGDIVERGVEIGAVLSKELLMSIFWPDTPLHDGAVIIRGDRIIAAGCILPLSAAPLVGNMGTRHRAAVGVSEETDAAALVVSEERGAISLAIGGKLTVSLDEVRLRRVIRNVLEK